MLLDCDFERHGLEKVHDNDGVKQFVLNPDRKYGLLKCSILIKTIRKKVQQVDLYIDGQLLIKEIMWSPEQLRQFLLFHKVIENNKK